jgi:splicing factor 3B subunit 2
VLIIQPIQDLDNTDEAAQNAAASKKTDSDSDEDEQDNPQREKGVSNKKKKVYMSIYILYNVI